MARQASGLPGWNSDEIQVSLRAIRTYVENGANRAIEWYWDRKRSKARWSRAIRFAAFTLTALGGLLPIALRFVATRTAIPDSGLAASLCLGLAAGLLGLDKAFGLSSGWTRYVMTATVLERALEEFRLEWMLLVSKADSNPTPEQVEALLKHAAEFRIAVAGVVLRETKDWVREFQSSLVELERETRVRVDVLRGKVESDR